MAVEGVVTRGGMTDDMISETVDGLGQSSSTRGRLWRCLPPGVRSSLTAVEKPDI